MDYQAYKLGWPAFATAFISGFAGAILFFGLAWAGPSIFANINDTISYEVADAGSYAGSGAEDRAFHVLQLR